MIYYIAMMLTSIFFAYKTDSILKRGNIRNFFDKKNPKKCFIYAFISFFIPFFISAFRAYNVGTDTSSTYYSIYKIIHSGGSIRDIGFGFITKVSDLMFNDFTGLLFITSLIIVGISYICIFRDSKYPIMSTLLFFTTNVYFISMNMIRQTIATCIFMVAIPLIKNKKCLLYFILMLIATFIHTSAIIYFPLYFLLKIKLDYRISILTIFVFILFGGILSNVLITFLLNFSYFQNYFAWYLTSTYNTGDFNLISFMIAICVYLVLLIAYPSAKHYFNYNLLLWLQTISICVLSLSGNLPLMQRTSQLFTFPLFIYLPEMYDYIKNIQLRKILCFFTNVGYLSYMTVTIFIMQYNEVVPYHFVF